MASDLCGLTTVGAVSPKLASDAPALGLEMPWEGVGRILFPLVLPRFWLEKAAPQAEGQLVWDLSCLDV